MVNPLQQTYEWFEARCGCLTASRAAAVFKCLKSGKPTAEYTNMIARLIDERASGEVKSLFKSPEMQWGIDHEDEARERYEEETGEVVELCGFILHPTIDFFGASPDGLVGDDGLLEIKCPNTNTHLERVITGVVPEEYKPQMLVQLLCTGRKWVDFVDYDSRSEAIVPGSSFFCVRFTPTEEELKDAETKCIAFLAAVQAKIELCKEKVAERSK